MFDADDEDYYFPPDLSETYYGITLDHGISCSHCLHNNKDKFTPKQYRMLRILSKYNADLALEMHIRKSAQDLADEIDKQLLEKYRGFYNGTV